MAGQLRQVNPNYGQATPREFIPGSPFPARQMFTGQMMRPEYNLQAMNPEIANALATMLSRSVPVRVNVPSPTMPQAPMGAARFLTGSLPYETSFGVPTVAYTAPQFQAGSYEDFMNRYNQQVADYMAQQEAARLAAETPADTTGTTTAE